MSYIINQQIIEKFLGIREQNGVNSNGAISALKCENVELVQTEIGNNIGIKTVQGNATIHTLPDGYSVKGIWKSVQDGVTYKFIYAEDDTKGTLFYINTLNQPQIIINDLSKTGECNALTMSSTAYDVFVFTNGVEAKTVCFTDDSAYGDTVKTINAVDYLGRSIHWLSMTEWNGFLVVASEYGVNASHQNDIYTWDDDPEDVADSWFINFGKKTTAVVSFSNGLYIFTKDDASFLNTTPNDTTYSYLVSAGMNGCFSYKSIVLHDKYIFFYDDNQKNIYYFQITDAGQVRPAGPVAKEIQSYFNNVSSLKIFSCIYEDKNEIWCLINDKLLIYDYVKQEWIERKEQKIETVAMIKNTVHTASGQKIFVENINSTFDGEYYPSVYKTTFMNFGSNTNLKKQKTPLLIVVNDNYVNDFYIQLTCDGKDKSPKVIHVNAKNSGQYASEEDVEIIIPDNVKYDSAYFAAENKYAKKVIQVTTPQMWYTLGVTVYTEGLGQGFFIHSMELKNLKGKAKTLGA